jgi:hypothetical protein
LIVFYERYIFKLFYTYIILEKIKKRGEKMKIRRRYKRIGFWNRKKRSWDDELEGMYKSIFSITTQGGGGIIWKVTWKGKTFITVSTYGTGVVSRWSRRSYNIYLHYILNEEGIEKLRQEGVISNELAEEALKTLREFDKIVETWRNA